MNDLHKIAGAGGCKKLTDGESISGTRIHSIIVLEDTTFSALTTEDGGVLAAVLGDGTAPATALITASMKMKNKAKPFTSVGVTSGTIMVYFA